MTDSKHLLQHVQDFFQDYLGAHRGLSSHTVTSYRDALKLFLIFVAQQAGKHTTSLTLDDLRAESVLAFLDDIEATRNNSVRTRNIRLAALRTFFRYLAMQDPLRAGQYQRIVAIPIKQAPQPVMEYLEVHEVKAILGAIDRKHAAGRRDYVLISLLYNTGARVQEICDLRVANLRLAAPPIVTLIGKGSKTRHVPLWPETASLLREHLQERGIFTESQACLFVNARGEPLTRYGIRHIIQTRVATALPSCPSLVGKRVSPHTLRHATAMHLLQSGVDLAVIKSWLGHVNLATTHGYVEIDMEMKRKALSACTPLDNPEKLQRLVEQNKDIISWLETL